MTHADFRATIREVISSYAHGRLCAHFAMLGWDSE